MSESYLRFDLFLFFLGTAFRFTKTQSTLTPMGSSVFERSTFCQLASTRSRCSMYFNWDINKKPSDRRCSTTRPTFR